MVQFKENFIDLRIKIKMVKYHIKIYTIEWERNISQKDEKQKISNGTNKIFLTI